MGLMTRRYRDSSPHTRNPARPERLQKITRQRAALVEREPGLLPCICDLCGTVLGLAEPGTALFCVDCGCWAAAIEDLAAIAEVPA
jgi:hypothetical protein